MSATKIIAILMGFILQLVAFIYYHYITEHIVHYYGESVDLGANALLITPSLLLLLFSFYLMLFYDETEGIPRV